jgi:hypothetical protein
LNYYSDLVNDSTIANIKKLHQSWNYLLNKLENRYLIKESFNTHMPNNPAKIFRNNPPKSSLENGGLYAFWIKKICVFHLIRLIRDSDKLFADLQICKCVY